MKSNASGEWSLTRPSSPGKQLFKNCDFTFVHAKIAIDCRFLGGNAFFWSKYPPYTVLQLINISQAGRLWKDGEFNSQVKTKLLNWKWNITNHSMEGEIWKSSQKLRLLSPDKCFCGGKFDRTNVNFFTIWFLNSYPSQNNNFKWYLSNRMGLDGEACVLRLLCEVILSQTNICTSLGFVWINVLLSNQKNVLLMNLMGAVSTNVY